MKGQKKSDFFRPNTTEKDLWPNLGSEKSDFFDQFQENWGKSLNRGKKNNANKEDKWIGNLYWYRIYTHL